MQAAAVGFDDLIPRMFRHRRNAAKILSRMSGASEQTAKNWLASRNTPQMAHMARIMAECEETRVEVMRLVDELRAKCG